MPQGFDQRQHTSAETMGKARNVMTSTAGSAESTPCFHALLRTRRDMSSILESDALLGATSRLRRRRNGEWLGLGSTTTSSGVIIPDVFWIR